MINKLSKGDKALVDIMSLELLDKGIMNGPGSPFHKNLKRFTGYVWGQRTNNRWTDKHKRIVIYLREVLEKDFSDICKLLNLTQREARNLYSCARYSKRYDLFVQQVSKNYNLRFK